MYKHILPKEGILPNRLHDELTSITEPFSLLHNETEVILQFKDIEQIVIDITEDIIEQQEVEIGENEETGEPITEVQDVIVGQNKVGETTTYKKCSSETVIEVVVKIEAKPVQQFDENTGEPLQDEEGNFIFIDMDVQVEEEVEKVVEVWSDYTNQFEQVLADIQAVVDSHNPLTGLIESKIKILSALINQKVIDGVLYNGKQLSLDVYSQNELTTLLQAVKSGATSVWYHFDGEECIEIDSITFSEMAYQCFYHVNYYVTLFNSGLRPYVKTLTTREEIEEVTIDTVLPQEYIDKVNTIVSSNMVAIFGEISTE